MGTLMAVNAIALCQPLLKAESITPSEGPTTGGFRVVIKGSGILPGTEAWMGGAPVTNVQISPDETELSGTAPAHSAGYFDVTLRTPAGQTTTLGTYFEYTASGGGGGGGGTRDAGTVRDAGAAIDAGTSRDGGADAGTSRDAGSTSAGYDMKVNIPLSGALGQSGITALAFAYDSGQLILTGMGGRLTVLDLPAPHTTVNQLRYVAPGTVGIGLSLPYGLAFAGSPSELMVLDYNSQGPGRTRLVRIARGADGIWGSHDDSQLSTTVLPTSLDSASGIAYRASNGELIFTAGGSSGNPAEIIVTDPGASTIRRRFALPTGFGWPQDLGFASNDRLMIVGSSTKLIVMNPDTGAVATAASDAIANLTTAHAFRALGLDNPGGVTAPFASAFGSTSYKDSPIFVANATSGSERVVVFVKR